MTEEQVSKLKAGDVVIYKENEITDAFIFSGKILSSGQLGAKPDSCTMQLEGKVPKTPAGYTAKFCKPATSKEEEGYKKLIASLMSIKSDSKGDTKKETAAKEPRKKLEKFKRLLPCKLTPDEIMAKYKELGKRESKCIELMREHRIKSDELKGIKEQVAGVQREINSLAHIAETMEEQRDVECQKVIDEKTRMVTIKRLDTKEVIEERKINENELQTAFTDNKGRSIA